MKETTTYCYILNMLTLGLKVYGKKIFEDSLAIYRYINILSLGCGQFGPQELYWQDLCREPLNIVTNYIYKMWAS